MVFAYFFIAQIFFYGMDSLLGAILNVRGRFGANMWTPVINNVVVILVGLIFLVTVGKPGASSATISSYGVALLGIGTTLGIVIQSVACSRCMWRAGFSMRLTLRLPARRDQRDRADVGLDVRLRVHPVARQPGGDPGGELRAAASNGISAYANA